MIWKLLRRNISPGQILGYAVANFIGLLIVLSAVRFYGDVNGAINSDSDSSIISKDYLVISAPVSGLNTLLNTRNGFSESDIADLLKQPWAVSAGEFLSADFHVNAYMYLGGRGMNTYLFLEAIPDEYIDIKPEGWGFNPAEGTNADIPIIISKDYLALYNFGFAGTRGLPQLTEDIISTVPIFLQLSGNGHNETFRAHIAGFSSRLNTIAVPYDFLNWANERYSTGESQNPSRLIVKVKNPGDPAIAQYMESNGYEVAGDKVDSGKASYFLTVLTGIVIAIGAIISALALFILMLSIFLLLQKNREKISNLLLLGYSPAQVSACYFRLIAVVNAAVLVLAVIGMFVASAIWEGMLSSLDIKPSSPLPAIVAGIVIMALITAANFYAISKSVKKDFRG